MTDIFASVFLAGIVAFVVWLLDGPDWAIAGFGLTVYLAVINSDRMT